MMPSDEAEMDNDACAKSLVERKCYFLSRL
jgi:hypothetical protein